MTKKTSSPLTDFTEDDYISPNWSDENHWNRIYSQETRNPTYLIETITKLGLNPPLKILDAGMGISTMPDLAAFMGHQVIGIDISPIAVTICRMRTVDREDLKKCIGNLFNRRYKFREEIKYLDRTTQEPVNLDLELDKYRVEGGKIIKYDVFDWNNPQLVEKYGQFDLILNQNGLRNASYEFIEQSFNSFHRLLNPGGVLVETNINVLDREKTFKMYAEKAGFTFYHEWDFLQEYHASRLRHDPNKIYCICFWPTG